MYKRQIERCRVIVHIVDMGAVDGRDPYEDYVTINKELGEYQYRLLERPQIVVANKMDEDGAEENLVRFKKQVGEDVKIFPISAIIHDGVDQEMCIRDRGNPEPSIEDIEATERLYSICLLYTSYS